MTDSKTSYYTYDAHGSVTAMDGTAYTYDAFGNLLNDADTYNPFCYSGEYYDSETGMIYLRNRYYDPSAGRFITEDPAEDGLNWYVYCGNNPVMFVDPLGLAMTLRGTGKEVSQIWGYLNELTDDELLLTQLEDEFGSLIDEYSVAVVKENDWGLDVGTSLVRRIINNNLFVYVEAAGIDEYGNQIGSRQIAINYENATNGNGTGSMVQLNLNTTVNVLARNKCGGKTQNEDMPKYIELGHELIHALRAMGGNTKHYNNKGTYAYTTPDGKVHTTTWKQEEFETTGISYYAGYKYQGIPVNAWDWYTTENALRDEHSLKRRAQY